jgi:Zn finger protein HypA/HybF involved in hydrogenase expression
VHELGITQGIVERAREAARQAGAVKVTDLFLTITPAADFQPESIEMYYEMLTDEDEMLRGAALHFARASIAATCLACGEEFPTETPRPSCPACGSQQVTFDPREAMIQLTDVGVDDGPQGESAPGGDDGKGEPAPAGDDSRDEPAPADPPAVPPGGSTN